MEDAARTTTTTKKENEEEKILSPPSSSSADVNIDSIDYFRTRILSKFEGTFLWSARFFIVYSIGMIFIMHKNSLVRMILTSILVSLIFVLCLWVAAQMILEKKVKSFLMMGSSTTRRTSMKEVFYCTSNVFPCTVIYLFIHFPMVIMISPPEVLNDDEPLYAALYLCAAVFVFSVLAIWNCIKLTDDLIAFERRVQLQQQQQSSATIHYYQRASYCKCTVPPNASASDTEWIRYYLLAN